MADPDSLIFQPEKLEIVCSVMTICYNCNDPNKDYITEKRTGRFKRTSKVRKLMDHISLDQKGRKFPPRMMQTRDLNPVSTKLRKIFPFSPPMKGLIRFWEHKTNLLIATYTTDNALCLERCPSEAFLEFSKVFMMFSNSYHHLHQIIAYEISFQCMKMWKNFVMFESFANMQKKKAGLHAFTNIQR